MEVSEEEFQSLKVEQSILVDFHQFPDKFIELLEECVSSRGEANPRFLAVLRLGAEEGDDSALGVVETNKFKHLSHISLAFAPGDDASIKKYLAARLMDVKGERDVWRRSHGDASDELRDARARELMEQKYALDSKYSDASSRATSAEAALETARAELKTLREANKDLDKGLNEREKSSQSSGMRVEWLEAQLKDKEELMKSLRSRVEAAESYKQSQESALEDARAAAVRAEDRVSASAGEIRKGNQIIERLQAELRSAKAKAKLKAAVIAQQETLLSERQSALDAAIRERAEATRETDACRSEIRALTARVEDQRRKLEESQALLASNQQMITWLNGQVNEAQLGRLGTSSRYSFRPSTDLPKPSVVASGGRAAGADTAVPV